MSNAAKAQELYKAQTEARKNLEEFFAPYVQIEQEIAIERGDADAASAKIRAEVSYHFDEQTSDDEAYYFTTGEFYEGGGYSTTSELRISKELLEDPETYKVVERQKIVDREQDAKRKRFEDLQRMAERAQRKLDEAQAALEAEK